MMSRRVCLLRRGVSILSDNCSKDSAAEEEEIRENADECSGGDLQPYAQSLSCSSEVWLRNKTKGHRVMENINSGMEFFPNPE